MARTSAVALVAIGLGAAVLVAAAPVYAQDGDGAEYPIKIDSRPSGASVYLETRDSDPVGKTPYKGTLDAGTHTVILELDGYEASVQTIRVKAKKKPQIYSAELDKLQSAFIEVLPAKAELETKGARILIDGVEMGNLPDTIQVPAGPHQVQVVKDGFQTFEEWVEPAEGEKKKVTVDLIADGSKPHGDGGEVHAGGHHGDEDPHDGPDVVKHPHHHAAAAPAERSLLLSTLIGLELGGRNFTYQNPVTSNLRPYAAGGVPMLRIAAELYPLATLGNKVLAGLGVAGSFGKAAPLESTTSDGQGIGTEWSEFDVGARYRYGIAPNSYVAAEAMYGSQQFGFTVAASNMALLDEIPDVDYRFTRFGFDGGVALATRFQAFAGFNYRLVSQTGKLGLRFAKSEVSCFGFSGGLGFDVTPAVAARLQASYTRYGHKFTPDQAGTFVADGGTDQFFGVTLGMAYSY